MIRKRVWCCSVCSWASALWIWWRRTKNKEQQQWWDWKDWNSSSSDNSTPSSQILSVTTSSSSVSFVPSSSPLLHSPLCPSSIKTLKLSRVCSNIRFALFLILLKVFLNKSRMEDRTQKETKQNKENSGTCLCRACIFKLLETELHTHLYDLFLFVVLG